MSAHESLEQAIASVSMRTGLLPSVVRACLTAYAADRCIHAAAWDEGWDTGAGWPQTDINPYRSNQ